MSTKTRAYTSMATDELVCDGDVILADDLRDALRLYRRKNGVWPQTLHLTFEQIKALSAEMQVVTLDPSKNQQRGGELCFQGIPVLQGDKTPDRFSSRIEAAEKRRLADAAEQPLSVIGWQARKIVFDAIIEAHALAQKHGAFLTGLGIDFELRKNNGKLIHSAPAHFVLQMDRDGEQFICK